MFTYLCKPNSYHGETILKAYNSNFYKCQFMASPFHHSFGVGQLQGTLMPIREGTHLPKGRSGACSRSKTQNKAGPPNRNGMTFSVFGNWHVSWSWGVQHMVKTWKHTSISPWQAALVAETRELHQQMLQTHCQPIVSCLSSLLNPWDPYCSKGILPPTTTFHVILLQRLHGDKL